MLFVNFHGSFGIEYQPWISNLKLKLEKMGHKVHVPHFPSDNWDEVVKTGEGNVNFIQNLNSWLKYFENFVLPEIKNKELIFIGLSLGPLFILHIVEKYNIKLKYALFTAPFLSDIDKGWEIDGANKSFYKNDFNFKKLRKLIPNSYVFYSDNDPFVAEKFSINFAKKLDSKLIFCKGEGHFNKKTSFPKLFNLLEQEIGVRRIEQSKYEQKY